MQQATTAGPSSEPVHKKKKTEEDFFTFIEEEEHSSMDSEILAEFELYLKENPIQFGGDDSAVDSNRTLTYWKTNSHIYPNLAVIVRDLFAVSASSGHIERVFSTALDIFSVNRNRFKPSFFLICSSWNKIRNCWTNEYQPHVLNWWLCFLYAESLYVLNW